MTHHHCPGRCTSPTYHPPDHAGGATAANTICVVGGFCSSCPTRCMRHWQQLPPLLPRPLQGKKEGPITNANRYVEVLCFTEQENGSEKQQHLLLAQYMVGPFSLYLSTPNSSFQCWKTGVATILRKKNLEETINLALSS